MYAMKHSRQLNAYRMNVPKLEVRVIISSVLGSAARWSCERYPKCEKMPGGSAAMVASVGAEPSPKQREMQITPMNAVMKDKVRTAR